MAKVNSSKPNRLIRCIKAPLQVLNRARQFYVRSLMGCARCSAQMASAAPRGKSRGFPRSMASSGDDDIRDLIRLAARGSMSSRSKDVEAVPRSQRVAVAIGRIDEEQPSTFEDETEVGMGAVYYPRGRSSAVVDKRRVRVLVG